MENTCVLHFLPVIPKWKVYNLPQLKPVTYYSILKQKREFQALLQKALVNSYLKAGSCTIVSKQCPFSVNAKNIDIIFLSEISLLSLTLRIQENQALKRLNNILVFLKNVSNDIIYEIKNDNIYTRCEENIKWEIFYSLFEFLLLRYGTGIIGAIFYNYLALGHILMNEKKLLYHLTLESSTLLKSVSKHREQNSIYSLKEPIRNSDKNQQNLTFNSLQCNKKSCVPLSSQEFISSISNLSVKRKAIDDIPSRYKLHKQDFSKMKYCFCFKANCKCHKSKWKVLRNIDTCSVDSYLDILLSKGVLSDAEFSDSIKSNGLDSFQEPILSENFSFSSHGSDKKDKCNIISQKQILEDSVKLVSSNASQKEEQLSISKSTENIFSKEKVRDVKLDEMVKEQTNIYSLQSKALNNPGLSNFIRKEDIPTLFSEFIDEEIGGKQHSSISKSTENISSKEKVRDVKIDERVKEQTSSYSLQTKASRNTGLSDGIKKEDIPSLFSEFIDEEVGGDDCAFSMFKTAAGKKVKISETALKSAEKIFGDVLISEEAGDIEMKTLDKSTTKPDFKNRVKTPVYKPPHFPSKSNTEKDFDETIDGALAEKIFEEISFDEKETENFSEDLCVPSSSSVFASNVSEKMVTCGKVRKSLGGRRSLKPYSVINA